MKRIKAFQEGFSALLQTRRKEFAPPKLRAAVAEIIEAVRQRGDDALCVFTRRFDKFSITPELIRLTEEELKVECEPALEQALEQAIANIRDYHEKQLRAEWFHQNPSGARVGEVVRPVDRAGLYIPAGTAPLVSTVLMTVIPAQVAGVKEICVATPPDAGGKVNQGILAACGKCGVTEIYRIGGAQAIAALAFGTETVKPVDVIAGPGNRYVTEAKRQVYGYVGIDLVAGPSESMIIIDSSANPKWVAADILSQAEHFESSTYLVSTSTSALDEVEARIRSILDSALPGLGLKEAIENRCYAIRANSLEQAADVANCIAPEHLQVITEDNERVLAQVRHAGAVFLGPYAPVPLGDFVAGPSHVLPTGGAARYMSGLSTDVFLKRIGVMECTEESFAKMAEAISAIGRAEELPAHEYTATVRRGKQ